MVTLMEYKIISGDVVEVRQARMAVRDGRELTVKRGTRVKGRTSIKKIEANEREAVKRLARILNANFGFGDLWLTLRYADGELPESADAAKRLAEKFLRRCRDELAKEGKKLRYVLCTSDRDPRDGTDARLHHHIVMDAMAWETVIKLWPENQITYRRLDGRRDYTGIARYMIGNAARGDGKKKWSTSRGLKKPIYTEPVPVTPRERPHIPAGAEIRENVELMDEESGLQSRYVRYIRKRRNLDRTNTATTRRR